jgi:hypothetical protein
VSAPGPDGSEPKTVSDRLAGASVLVGLNRTFMMVDVAGFAAVKNKPSVLPKLEPSMTLRATAAHSCRPSPGAEQNKLSQVGQHSVKSVRSQARPSTKRGQSRLPPTNLLRA